MGKIIKDKLIYAIIPARSGSKGVIDKNIRSIDGKPLLSYAIAFAKAINADRIICSTDSPDYAKIAEFYGAQVPFLRSRKAASDSAMEGDILEDLYANFEKMKISQPDYIIWLRPTFVFRDKVSILNCLEVLEKDQTLSSARTVCEAESRLYSLNIDKLLIPNFEDSGKSMIRRQDVESKFKVYSTDIIRSNTKDFSNTFLGNKVFGYEIDKICGLDIDDEIDFKIVELLVKYEKSLINQYLY
ncbi:acylneuraminate cytidylyltransferase family protein [Arenibacter sp. F26102]|uniref:acylneuraminate cytidylyltransferase family protein n=1 Tax=Arenibacter sp. F26102 TaxID=2926416 RepID=UPI001FF5A778|nr:acylneuraminate cytidylyltransferase family protein [Arenibacter sp. F26102]MCK0144104.1 acylneuraminate cytidylyltransferase family protein [Arenibacter sp. F26102]